MTRVAHCTISLPLCPNRYKPRSNRIEPLARDGLFVQTWKAHYAMHRWAFLFQWLSVLIQRYNAVVVLGTFTHTIPEDVM